MKYQIPVADLYGATTPYKIIHRESGCVMFFNRSNLTYYGQCELQEGHGCFQCSVHDVNIDEFDWFIEEPDNGICFY